MELKDVVYQAFAALESDDPRQAVVFLHADFVWQGTTPHPITREKFLALMCAAKRGFPDYTFNLKIVDLQEGNTVRAVIEPIGRHTGVFELPGLTPLQPTDQIVALPRQVLDLTLREGKIVLIIVEVASGGGLADLLAYLGQDVSQDWLDSIFA